MSKLLQAMQGIQSPKISLREVKGGTFQAQRVAPTRTDVSNPLGQVMDIAKDVTQLAQGYISQREKEGQKRKNEILLQNMSPGEIGKMRNNGTLLYQDDPYAMRALERELGRQEAYNVDGAIQQRIHNGDYNTREEMEQDRANMMKQSRENMGAAYGMPNGGTQYFNEGYTSDITERNMAIYNAQAKKQDQMHRNEARVAIENNVSDIINSGQPADIVVQYLKNQKASGVIRNDAEYETYLMKAVKSASSRADGVAATQALLESKVSLYGEETTLRARFGEEAYNSFTMTAAENVIKMDTENAKFVHQQIDFISTLTGDGPDDFERGIDAINKLEAWAEQAQGTPAYTAVKQQLEQAKSQFNVNIKAGNERRRKSLVAQTQQTNRLIVMGNRLTQIEAGEAVPMNIESFAETEQTGKFTSNDYALFFEQRSDAIRNDPNLTPAEKQRKYLSTARLMKDVDNAGFGAQYKAMTGKIASELAAVDMAVEAGQDRPATPTLNSFMELYRADPTGFMEVFGQDSEMALDISMITDMNIDPVAYRKGKRSLASMSKEELAQKTQQWNSEIDKSSNKRFLEKLPQNQRQAYMAMYAGLDGIGNAQKMEAINKHAEANYQLIDQSSGLFRSSASITGIVQKELLMVDPRNPKSVDQGSAILSSMISERYGDDATVAVSSANGRIRIMDSRGSIVEVHRQDLLNYEEARKQQ